MRYVLITPARNEERNIERTLKSVVAQTVLPLRWVIVDDGSTDRTIEILAPYAATHPWIQIVRQPRRAERNFAGKAEAVKMGLSAMQELSFEIVGNLDADVSFEPNYMEFVLNKFSSDPRLGIAGTPFTEDGYDSVRDSFEGQNYVAGPCQLFRLTCFQDIGGYIANRAGGIDWIAVMTARMKGWHVEAFPEKRFHHHRTMGTAARGTLSALFSYGEKDYYLGGSPIWQLFRVCYRMTKKPIIAGGLALFLGYSWAAARRMERPVSAELMRFHRRDQMQKLKGVLASLATLRKVDGFSVRPKRST